jgi:hypothetical protein
MLKIFEIATPYVWQVRACKDHISLAEWMNRVADEARARSLKHNEQLKFRMKMPVGIEVRRSKKLCFHRVIG